MSDIPNPSQHEQPQPSAAELRGLVNGEFRVKRSAKNEQGEHEYDEGGWALTEVYPYTDPKSGETANYARIDLPDGRYKNVKLQDLLSWQPHTESDLDANTVPREVLNRLKNDLMDIGEPPVEDQVEVSDELRGPTGDELIQKQIEQIRNGEGRAVVVPLEKSEVDDEVREELAPRGGESFEEGEEQTEDSEDTSEAKDGEVEKRKQLIAEVLGERQEVEQVLEELNKRLRSALHADEDIERRINGLMVQLDEGVMSLRRMQGANEQRTPYQVLENFHQAVSLARAFADEADQLMAYRASVVGEGSEYDASVHKLIELHQRLAKETFQGLKDKLADQLGEAITDLHKGLEIKPIDRSLQTYAEEARVAIGRIADNLEYEGPQSVSPQRIEVQIDELQQIKDLLKKSNNALNQAARGTTAASTALMPLIEQ